MLYTNTSCVIGTKRNAGFILYKYIKRAIDFFFALVIGIIFIPFGLIIAVMIKANSKGSVFFKQDRVGKERKIFKIYKFRTMYADNNCMGQAITSTDRITGVGKVLRKLSLDEMPQLINIIKGEMSFIGPRPLLVEYVPRYTSFQMRRHEVLPGISGWAQVNGRNTMEWEEKFQYDVWYVDNISFLVDIKILISTIEVLLARKGVNNTAENTMSLFTGSEK